MLKLIIDKINTRRKDARFVDNMRVFQQVLKNNPNAKHVADPSVFCPLSWWNCKESYTDHKYKTKYSVEALTNDLMLQHSIGIHMWNNFTFKKWKIDFDNIDIESLYNRLYCLINNGLKKNY